MENIILKRIANLHSALDLMDFAIALMRQQIVRKLPNAPSTTIDRELRRWLIEQPSNFTPQHNPEDSPS